MKKLLVIIGIVVLIGAIGLIIYNVNFKDKSFSDITEINNDEITSIEVKKLSGDSDQEQIVNVTDQKQIIKIMDDFEDYKWVREPKSLNPDEYYSVILKKDNNSVGVILVNGSESFLVSTNKEEGSNSNSFTFNDNNSLEIQELFK